MTLYPPTHAPPLLSSKRRFEHRKCGSTWHDPNEKKGGMSMLLSTSARFLRVPERVRKSERRLYAKRGNVSRESDHRFPIPLGSRRGFLGSHKHPRRWRRMASSHGSEAGANPQSLGMSTGGCINASRVRASRTISANLRRIYDGFWE